MERFFNIGQNASSSSVDKDLNLRLAEARVNNLIFERGILFDDRWVDNTFRWHNARDIRINETMALDDIGIVFRSMDVFPENDKVDKSKNSLEFSVRGEDIGTVLEVDEQFSVAVSGQDEFSGARLSIAQALLELEVHENTSGVLHRVWFKHRNRPATITQEIFENDEFPIAQVELLDAERLPAERPKTAHVILPNLSAMRQFIRKSIKNSDCHQDSQEFWHRMVAEDKNAQLQIAGGFFTHE